MLKAVFDLKMSIIDFRSFHPHGNFNVHVVNEMYLKDNDMLIYDTPDKEDRDNQVLAKRMEELYKAAQQACGEESANIKVFRWLPGSKGADAGQHTVPGVKSPKAIDRPTSAGNLRQRSSSGGSMAGRDSGTLSVAKGDLPYPAYIQNERRSALNHNELLEQLDQLAYIQAEKEFQKKQRHHVSLSAAMGSHTHPGELVYHQRHHELDGYVHSDPHDAFDPDEIEGEVFDSDSESSDGEVSVGGGNWTQRISRGPSAPGSGWATPAQIEASDVEIEMLEVGGVGRKTGELAGVEDLVDEVRHRVEHAHSVSAQQGMVVDLEAVRERLSTIHINDTESIIDDARESLKAVVEGGEDGDDVEDLKSGADRERKVPRAPRNTQELFREK